MFCSKYRTLLPLLIVLLVVVLPRTSYAASMPPLLQQMMNEKNPGAARKAYQQLRWSKDPAVVDVLLAGLQQHDPNMREFCSMLLCWRKDPHAVSSLCQLLRQRDLPGRVELLESLHAFSDPRLIDPLLELLKDHDARVRAAALTALAPYNDPRITEAVLGLVNDKELAGNNAIATVLISLDDPRAISPLISIMMSKRGIDYAIRKRLVKYGSQAVEPLLAVLTAPGIANNKRVEILYILGGINDPRIVPALTPYLQEQDDKLRVATLRALSTCGGAGLDAVLALLHGADAPVRCEVVNCLWRTKDPRALDVLLTSMRDTDAGVRRTALDVLRQKRPDDPRVTDAYFAALDDTEATIRTAALDGVTRSGDPRTFTAVLPLLEDPDIGMCEKAAEYLGGTRDPRIIEPLLAAARRPRCPDAVLTAMVMQREPRVVPLLIRKLHPPDDEYFIPNYTISSAADALAYLGDPAFEPLVEALHNPEADIRAGAAFALGECGDPRALAPLHAALRDKAPVVRRWAVLALHLFQDECAVPWLIESLRDNDVTVRKASITALKSFHDPRMIAPLLRLAGDGKSGVQTDAITALHGSTDPRVVAFMLKTMHSRDDHLRIAATLTMATDPRARQSLQALLAAKDPFIRESALEALCELGDPQAISRLAVYLCSKEMKLKEEAYAALLSFHDPRALREIITAGSNGDFHISRDDTDTLVAKVTPQMVPLLQEKIHETFEEDVQQVMITMLGGAGAAGVAPLLDYLQDGDSDVRNAAVSGLGYTHAPGAVKPLLALLQEKDDSLAGAAIKALMELRDPRAVEPLLAIIQAGDHNRLSIYAIEAMEVFKDRRAVEPLLAILTAPDEDPAKNAAIYALGEIGDPRAAPVLLELLAQLPNNSNSLVEALGNIGDQHAADLLLALLQREIGHLDGTPDYALPVKQSPTANQTTSISSTTLIEALGKLRDPRAVPMLVAALQRFDQDTVEKAATALGRIGDPAAADALLAQLRRGPVSTEGADELHITIATALGQLKDDHVRTLLRTAVTDDNWRVREGVARAMGEMAEPWAVAPLRRLLHDPNPHVCAAAAEALKR